MNDVKVPKTLAALFAEVESLGGHAEIATERLWDVFLPVFMVGDFRSDVRIGSVGYYVSGGKNHIGPGIHGVRARMARHF